MRNPGSAHRATLVSLLTVGIVFFSTSAHALSRTSPLTGVVSNRTECLSRYLVCSDSCPFADSFCQDRCFVLYNQCLSGLSLAAFFDTASLSRDARVIGVGGPLSCPATATADVEVTLSQRGIGAIARGSAQVRCPAEETTFSLDVHTIGAVNLVVGLKAQACGILQVHGANAVLDAYQWCREVTIVPEEE